jgi:hypothetical protein
MTEQQLITDLQTVVKNQLEAHLRTQSIPTLASIDATEALARRLLEALADAIFATWNAVLLQLVKRCCLRCPRCGRRRKCKTRSKAPMRIQMLGLELTVPNLYLECPHCPGHGISITKVLTGLQCGDASTELTLLAGYAGAEHSYGKASRDLEVHHGRSVERTAVRRMSLQVEAQANDFTEEKRREALERVAQEARTEGVDRLMIQGDGGSVRVGELVDCEPGDEGFGKSTPKTGRAVRKRETTKREIITMDAREPGKLDPAALDVLVPCCAPAGERPRRMLALAGRGGLGDNTTVLGLGDLGSGLPDAFDEAFVGYEATYSADWQHVRNYVRGAAVVLKNLDVERWQRQMLDAIWRRDEPQRDALLHEAHEHRVAELPDGMERCPLHALQSYVTGNWHRMHAAHFKQQQVDFVSARAEAQVRDRTKRRFSVPGAWRQENLEGKATLRSIIEEGSWECFRRWTLQRARSRFEREQAERLERAVAEDRLTSEQISVLLGQFTENLSMVAAA